MSKISVYSTALSGGDAWDAENSVPQRQYGAKSKALIALLFIFVAIIFLELMLYFIILPMSKRTEIIFSGMGTENERYYRQNSEAFFSKSWIKLQSDELEALFYDTFPLVERVNVKKSFPNKILVNIEERIPVVSSIVLINGVSVPILIDRKGVVFQVGGNVAATNLPLLSGLNFSSMEPGVRLNEKLQPLMEKIAEISATNPSYLANVSEIKIVPKEYGSFDLMVYPVDSKVRVLLDRNFDTETLQCMMVALDVVKSVDKNVYEMDLRYGSISYKNRPQTM